MSHYAAAAQILRPLLSGDEHFAVTGATGWLGTAALALLDELLGASFPEQVTAYAGSARTISTPAGRTLDVQPLDRLPCQAARITHLLHFAFLTRDRLSDLDVPSYVAQNLTITTAVLAAVAAHRPRGFVLASSGAVYANATGSLATDLVGNSYGTLKHVDELALRQAMTDIGGATAVARVFSVAGSGITKPDLYALGSLITMAQQGGPIVVRATRPVFRSYAAVEQVVALALWSVLRGESTVFDSGGTVVEVGELAGLVAAEHGLPGEAVQRTWDRSAEPDRYVGDLSHMQDLSLRAGAVLRDLAGLVRETSEDLRRRRSLETSATIS